SGRYCSPIVTSCNFAVVRVIAVPAASRIDEDAASKKSFSSRPAGMLILRARRSALVANGFITDLLTRLQPQLDELDEDEDEELDAEAVQHSTPLLFVTKPPYTCKPRIRSANLFSARMASVSTIC